MDQCAPVAAARASSRSHPLPSSFPACIHPSDFREHGPIALTTAMRWGRDDLVANDTSERQRTSRLRRRLQNQPHVLRAHAVQRRAQTLLEVPEPNLVQISGKRGMLEQFLQYAGDRLQ